MTAFSRTLLALTGCLILISLTGCQGIQGSGPTGDSQSTISDTADSARYHYLESLFTEKAGEADKTMAALTLAIQADPESSLLKRELVRLYLKANQVEAARELARELVEHDPDDVDNLILQVRLQKEDEAPEKMEPLLSRILELDPKNKETYLRLGKIYMGAEAHAKALALFEKMVIQFPDYYVAHFYLGETRMVTGNPDGAKVEFLKTLELEPDLVEPRFRLVELYRSQGIDPGLKKSLALLEEILELEPDDDRARLEMALILEKTGQKQMADEAFAVLNEALNKNNRLIMTAAEIFLAQERNLDALTLFKRFGQAHPENDQINFFTAMAYEGLGNKEKAIAHYLKVSQAHPHYKKMMFSIAYLYRDMGKTDQARILLEEFHDQRPKDIDIITYLSSFYEEDQEYNLSLEILEKGLVLAPENTTLLFRLGVIQDKAGDKEACIATMKQVIDLDPRDASALNYLGYTYADLGVKLDQALDLITRALEAKPDDGFITDSLGWVYYQMKDYEKAIPILEKAARLSDHETIISEHLGDAYAKVGRIEDAKTAYLKAIDNIQDKTADADRIKELRKKILNLPPVGVEP